MTGLKKIDLPGIETAIAKQMATAALKAIQNGQLGYAIITAQKRSARFVKKLLQ